MRKMCFAVLLPALICGLSSVCATGQPMSPTPTDPPDGTVSFNLDDQQVREVERLRKFRPTPAQLAVLRAVSPACPHLLEVITTRFQGCCCTGRNKAEWTAPRTVEVALGALRPWDLEEENFLRLTAGYAGVDRFHDPVPTPRRQAGRSGHGFQR